MVGFKLSSIEPERKMADVMSILSSNYMAVGATNFSNTKYVAVDPKSYEGTWTGKYGSNKSFTVTVSNVNGFRAMAKYQSGGTVNYQPVLIKDSAFRVGDSKFTLTKPGTAQVKTVITDPVTSATSVESGYATQG
jgi:hypothetical protein